MQRKAAHSYKTGPGDTPEHEQPSFHAEKSSLTSGSLPNTMLIPPHLDKNFLRSQWRARERGGERFLQLENLLSRLLLLTFSHYDSMPYYTILYFSSQLFKICAIDMSLISRG